MRLKELRKLNNLTQENIANQLNVAPSTYRGYESETYEPTIETLIKLANIYKVSVDYIIGNDKNSLNNNEYDILTIFNQLKDIGKGKLIGYAKSLLEEQNNKNKKINANYIDW